MIRIQLEGDCTEIKEDGFVDVSLVLDGIVREKVGIYNKSDEESLPTVGSSTVLDDWPGTKPLDLWALGSLTIEDLFGYRLYDIPGNTCLTVDTHDKESERLHAVELTNETIAFRIWYSHHEWLEDWSPRAFLNEVKRLCGHEKYNFFEEVKEDVQEEYSAIFLYHTPNSGKIIKDLYIIGFQKAAELHQEVLTILNERFSEYPFLARFVFPEHIKHECEQYLAYFGQFLTDLGIESQTDISRKGKEILFSVMPKDKNEAIENISQALSVFLLIPSLDSEHIVPNTLAVENQIKVQRLEASVNHLKAQLSLAKATVITQQDHINTLKECSPHVLISSLKEVIEEGNKSDSVKFLHGLISIKRFKGNGFEIDFAKVASEVKKLAGKLLK